MAIKFPSALDNMQQMQRDPFEFPTAITKHSQITALSTSQIAAMETADLAALQLVNTEKLTENTGKHPDVSEKLNIDINKVVEAATNVVDDVSKKLAKREYMRKYMSNKRKSG